MLACGDEMNKGGPCRSFIELDLPLLIDSAFAAGAAMISFGAVLGKVTPAQIVWLLVLQVPIYAFNAYLVTEASVLPVSASHVPCTYLPNKGRCTWHHIRIYLSPDTLHTVSLHVRVVEQSRHMLQDLRREDTWAGTGRT